MLRMAAQDRIGIVSPETLIEVREALLLRSWFGEASSATEEMRGGMDREGAAGRLGEEQLRDMIASSAFMARTDPSCLAKLPFRLFLDCPQSRHGQTPS
jgi:hypothetical protein